MNRPKFTPHLHISSIQFGTPTWISRLTNRFLLKIILIYLAQQIFPNLFLPVCFFFPCSPDSLAVATSTGTSSSRCPQMSNCAAPTITPTTRGVTCSEIPATLASTSTCSTAVFAASVSVKS